NACKYVTANAVRDPHDVPCADYFKSCTRLVEACLAGSFGPDQQLLPELASNTDLVIGRCIASAVTFFVRMGVAHVPDVFGNTVIDTFHLLKDLTISSSGPLYSSASANIHLTFVDIGCLYLVIQE